MSMTFLSTTKQPQRIELPMRGANFRFTLISTFNCSYLVVYIINQRSAQ